MKLSVEPSIFLVLAKEEMTLIGKALCGKLRPGEETEAALQLGRAITARYASELREKSSAAEHAQKRSEE